MEKNLKNKINFSGAFSGAAPSAGALRDFCQHQPLGFTSPKLISHKTIKKIEKTNKNIGYVPVTFDLGVRALSRGHHQPFDILCPDWWGVVNSIHFKGISEAYFYTEYGR